MALQVPAVAAAAGSRPEGPDLGAQGAREELRAGREGPRVPGATGARFPVGGLHIRSHLGFGKQAQRFPLWDGSFGRGRSVLWSFLVPRVFQSDRFAPLPSDGADLGSSSSEWDGGPAGGADRAGRRPRARAGVRAGVRAGADFFRRPFSSSTLESASG